MKNDDKKVLAFEVGKFYAIQPFARYTDVHKKVSAKCVRTTKCTVVFEYIYERDGNMRKETVRFRKMVVAGKERTYDPDTWSMILPTCADELRQKPSIWDEVK